MAFSLTRQNRLCHITCVLIPLVSPLVGPPEDRDARCEPWRYPPQGQEREHDLGEN